MQVTEQTSSKAGYYTVHIMSGADKIPYTIFADSDYHAARLIKRETGYLASQEDVDGPFRRAVLPAAATAAMQW